MRAADAATARRRAALRGETVVESVPCSGGWRAQSAGEQRSESLLERERERERERGRERDVSHIRAKMVSF